MNKLYLNSKPFEIFDEIHERITSSKSVAVVDEQGFVYFKKIPAKLEHGVKYQFRTKVSKEQYDEIKKWFSPGNPTVSTDNSVMVNVKLNYDETYIDGLFRIELNGTLSESIAF